MARSVPTHPVWTSNMKATRAEVYAALDSEREYQNKKWNHGHDHDSTHTIGEWVIYMEHYLNEVKKQLTLLSDEEVTHAALSTIRKVAALGVACMEQQGAPKRETN